MTNIYNVGDLVTLTANFTQVSDDEPINPTLVVFTVVDPDGNETVPEVSNPATGAYTTQISIDQPGTWRWRATGTGAAQAAADSFFEVQPQTF